MKLTIETRDRDESLLALHGGDFYGTLWELDQECRNKLKYGHQFQTPDEVLEWARDQIREELESRGISLDIVT